MEKKSPTQQKNAEKANLEKETVDELANKMERLEVGNSSQKDPSHLDSKMELNENDMGFLDDCLLETNKKLNLTADEKDDLDDLDDEEIEKEYEEFMRNISQNAQVNDFMGQLSQLMESGINIDGNNPEGLGNFLGGLDESADFDVFTDNLIGQFIEKDIIYEPLTEARQKVEEHVAAKEENRTEQNLKVLTILNNILSTLDKEDYKSPENREKVMKLFEDLHDNGGLPEEIMKECLTNNPELKNLQNMGKGQGCSIF